jgi:iron(III) transport system permease protein
VSRAAPARAGFPLAVTAFAFAFLALFLLWPLWNVLQASLLDRAGTSLTLDNYARVLSRPFYQRSLWNSLGIGAVATLVTTALAVPLAFCIARVRLPGKPLLFALATLPLVLPSFVGAYALVLLFGRAGVVTQALLGLGIDIGSIYGMPGLVTVYALTLYPYVLLPTVAALKAVDVSIEEAGQNLGASRWRTIRTVVLPLVLPSILAGALLVFMETLENFGVPVVLAEDRPILAVEAYKLFVGEVGSNPATAGVLAVLLVFCTTAALLLQRYWVARRRYATGARTVPPELELGPGPRLLATAYAWGVALLALVPFFAVVVLSFLQFRGPVLQGGFSLDNFAQLFQRSPRPLVNTLTLATAAAIGAGIVGVPIGYVLTRHRSRLTGFLDVIAMVPFAVAGTVLGIGMVISFNSGFLVLTGGGLILVIAYVVRKLPFNVRASSAILHQLDPSLEEASINLGVSPARTFFILTLPLIAGGVAGGMILTWVTVASELSSTVVLYSGPWTTMTVVMFQALEGTSAGAASAAATVLIVVTVLPLVLVHRLLRRHQSSLL